MIHINVLTLLHTYGYAIMFGGAISLAVTFGTLIYSACVRSNLDGHAKYEAIPRSADHY